MSHVHVVCKFSFITHSSKNVYGQSKNLRGRGGKFYMYCAVVCSRYLLVGIFKTFILEHKSTRVEHMHRKAFSSTEEVRFWYTFYDTIFMLHISLFYRKILVHCEFVFIVHISTSLSILFLCLWYHFFLNRQNFTLYLKDIFMSLSK